MTQNIVAFFCGTGYYTGNDACYQALRLSLPESVTLLGYDGCQVHGGGLFAYGVEEQADAFVEDLRQHLSQSDQNVHINLIGHSRGALSALLAIKKIHNDPELIKRCTFTADFRDPVTGNLQLSNKIAGNLTISNQVKDMSSCHKLQKVCITLHELPFLSLGFDAIIPHFGLTEVEVEVIPGYHDVQQRTRYVQDFEHASLFSLGMFKTMYILAKDGIKMNYTEEELVDEQVKAYEEIVPWVRERGNTFAARALHTDGRIIANKHSAHEIAAINWRHAELMKITPEHVLFGKTHAHYNYRKDLMERYCDLTLALDEFAAHHVSQTIMIEELRQNAQAYCREERDLATYKNAAQNILVLAGVDDKRLNIPLNYLLLDSFFSDLDETINTHVPVDSHLSEQLNQLKLRLCDELCAEIETGKSTQDLMRSKVLKIIRETDSLLQSVYSGTLDIDEIIAATDNYLKNTINPAHNWQIGAKIAFGALITFSITLVAAALGAVIGFGLGVIIGAATGPAAIAVAFTAAFITAVEIGFIAATSTSAAIGLGVGVWQSVAFFKPTAVESSIQELADVIYEQPELRP